MHTYNLHAQAHAYKYTLHDKAHVYTCRKRAQYHAHMYNKARVGGELLHTCPRTQTHTRHKAHVVCTCGCG